jgi:multidrug resistance efflux pump
MNLALVNNNVKEKMKSKIFSIMIFMVLVVSACSTSTNSNPGPTKTPLAIPDSGVLAEGHLEPIHYIDLALNASGLVSEVLFKEGDEVVAGDVIARLVASEAQTLESARAKAAGELTTAYQEVRDAQYKLDNFDVPSTFDGMTPSEAVEAMLIKLDKARADFEPYKNLSDRSLEQTEAEKKSGVVKGTAKIYKKVLDDAWAYYRKAILWLELESTLQNANARLVLAQRDYDSLQDPSFSVNTAGARATLANAEVRAPFPGVITDLNLKVGEFAASGKSAITVADNSQWIVKTKDLTEIDVVNIKEGQAVTIKFDAFPSMEFKGNVLSIGEHYSENQGDIVYEVTILLTDKNPAMRWGMTAEVKFE